VTTSRPVPIEKTPDHERLTPRENEVLTYLSKGFTIKEIANLMGIKWFTVNDHIKSIYKKLNVSSRLKPRFGQRVGWFAKSSLPGRSRDVCPATTVRPFHGQRTRRPAAWRSMAPDEPRPGESGCAARWIGWRLRPGGGGAGSAAWRCSC
jgi:DNA-binding CsgD family transcriptional regulator